MTILHRVSRITVLGFLISGLAVSSMKWKTLAAAAFLIFLSAMPVASQTLTVSVTGSGSVRGTGINCGSDCSETVPMSVSTRGARPGRVTLTAAGVMPASGPNWGGACQGTTGAVCTVAVPPGGVTVSAGFGTMVVPDIGAIGDAIGGVIFSPTMISSVGPGTIGNSPALPVPVGTVLTHRAEPNAGASFVSWTGKCTGTNPVCTHTFNSSFTLLATFGWPVTVAIEGPPGGSVIGVGIDCRTVCTGVAVPPTLSLQATAAAGYAFQEWGGDCTTAGSTTSGAVCSLSATAPKSVTARFRVVLLTPPPSP